jgi:GMP synthase-like glutamine amidotransferase
MKPILVLQHIPCEGPGRMLEFARVRGVPLETVHFLEGGVLPTHTDFSAILALGGSMNVYEEDKYPWLASETRFIADWVSAGKPYLGLCLGGQLLAKAVGGRVTKNARKEIGNFEVQLTTAGQQDPLFAGFPTAFPVFQWHGDTFSDLAGGVCLASSAWCAHQAFRFGSVAYGLQFHAEITQAMAQEWLHEYNPEIIEEKLNPNEILAGFGQLESQYANLSESLFTNFFKLAKLAHPYAP